ncbi:LPS-assembly protein [Succinivibrio dextrinosolvens]|uniref:LPS-assembly protein LptD n=1 Tax=Succinivibrio dextrinosolvens TaxID=83771 RepID=UPI0008F41D4B|nr:LPS assembly protein LptD [Succinivibrio dextrinosolvens]SFS77465.1 LPS-assembly protein [Succinivibrio dextrinosolvens]
MKTARKQKIALATLSVAVSLALCSSAYANIQSEQKETPAGSVVKGGYVETEKNSSYDVETKLVKESDSPSIEKTTNFSTKTMEKMNTPSAEEYLLNRNFAESSTFPMRMIKKLSAPWLSAPRSPITGIASTCFYGVPSYRFPMKYDVHTTPITVTSDKVSGDISQKDKQVLTYTGKVEITQGDKKILTDKATYNGEDKTLTTEGSSTVSTGEYTTTSKEPLVYNLEKKTVTGTNTVYQLNGSVLNGDAEEYEFNNEKGTRILKKATLSGCPADKRSWHMSSTSVEIDEGDSFGSAWNDVFYLGKVPVFYTPYANFPVTNKRKTGLLPPRISYSTGSGFSYEFPLYLNLAPNYDATLTPGRDSKHGAKYDAEFRYLPFENFSGSIVGTYLPDDPKFTRVVTTTNGTAYALQNTGNTNSSDRKRWFLNLKNKLTFLENDLVFQLDYSRVRDGDYTYLTDISQKNAAVTDSSLVQSLKGTYDQDKYDVSVELRKYQNMFSTTNFNTYKPFAMLPQIKLKGYDTYGRFTYKMEGELTRFSIEKYTDDNKSLYMNRSHIQPSIKYNAFDSYGTTLDFGVTGFLTHYNQSDLKYFSQAYQQKLGYARVQDSVTRSLYLLEAKAKTTLERKVLDMNHTQTLEPEIKYMYIPYRDQSTIPLYDTTSRYDEYYTLFSPMRYAGIDRIANLNTITAGFTSRLLDSHDREILRFSLAQAYNMDKQRVKLNEYYTYNYENRHTSPIEASFNAEYKSFNYHAQVQYDPEDNEFYSYNAGIHYTHAATGFKTGITYRHLKNGNYQVNNPLVVRDLSQIGVTASVPLSPSWTVYGASYRDLEQNYNIDTKLGIKYDECCYSVALVYENYLNYNSLNSRHENDKIIGLNVEFKGLYTVNARKISDPRGTNTHYLPDVIPSNLNR